MLLAAVFQTGWAQQVRPPLFLALAVDPRLSRVETGVLEALAERSGVKLDLRYNYPRGERGSIELFAKQSATLVGHGFDGLLTTVAGVSSVPRDSPTYNAGGEMEAGGPMYYVHVLFRDPDMSRVCALKVSDIACLRKRGTEIFTTGGLSSASAAAITHAADDLGANCETGQNCHEAAEPDVQSKFTEFLEFQIGIKDVPHLVIYTVAEDANKGYRDALVRGLATLPRVGMAELTSLMPRLAGAGYRPVTIQGGVYIDHEVRTARDLEIAYTLPKTLQPTTREAFARLANAMALSLLPTPELKKAALDQLLGLRNASKERFQIAQQLLAFLR